MGNYTPVTWDTSGQTVAGTLTAAQLTELSAQVAEEQLRNHCQSERMDRLVTGQGTLPRWASNNSSGLGGSGFLHCTFFTADQTATWAQFAVRAGSTAAGATPTLIRWGLYSEAGNGDLTLVASIANDTALLNVASGTFTKTWTTPYTVTKGNRYASAWLVVTSATMPTIIGTGFNAGSSEALIAPRIAATVSGQTDLPSSVTNASLSAGASPIYTRMY